MKNIIFALPPLPDQAAILADIADKTKAILSAMDATRREIDLQREFRTRLIADVVTGKVDVRDIAARLHSEVEEIEPVDETKAEATAEEPTDDLGEVAEIDV
jgi:hypothetical protein